jgi:hypothetical protein
MKWKFWIDWQCRDVKEWEMWRGCRDAKKTKEIHTLNVQNVYGIPCLQIRMKITTNSGRVKEWKKKKTHLWFMVAIREDTTLFANCIEQKNVELKSEKKWREKKLKTWKEKNEQKGKLF